MHSAHLNFFIFILLFSNYAFAKSDITKKISQLEKTFSTKIGISAVHMESGKFFHHRESEKFHMASTVKLPLAIYFLHLTETSRSSLSKMAKIEPHDLSLGSSLMGYYGT